MSSLRVCPRNRSYGWASQLGRGEGCGGGGADVIVDHEPAPHAVLGEHKLTEAEGHEGEDATALPQHELGT